MDPSTTRILLGAAGGAAEADNSWNLDYVAFNGSPQNWVHFPEYSQTGVHFKSDGTKMYTVSNDTDRLYEYDLSPAWDISTASFVQSNSILPYGTNPTDLFFSSDGTKVYIVDGSSDRVTELTLSNAWDISNISASTYITVATSGSLTGIYLSPNGEWLFVSSTGSPDYIYQYFLSTNWDLTSAVYEQSLDISGYESNPYAIFFNPTGNYLYFIGGTSDRIFRLFLTASWDISTQLNISYAPITRNTVGDYPFGLYFKPDGSEVFISTAGTDSVYRFNLSTEWDVTSLTFNYPTTNYFNYFGSLLGATFSVDGSKMYTLNSTDRLLEFTLTTPWQVETASYTRQINVGSEDSIPLFVTFRPDGLKMYMIGSATDRVYEYNLTTAWNILSASYSQYFQLPASTYRSVVFRPDGLKMYTCQQGSFITEYTLSTEWDVTSAGNPVNITNINSNIRGAVFNDDGDKMYVLDANNLRIYTYTLSTAWDLSTATVGPYYSFFASLLYNPTSITWDTNGEKFFVSSSLNNNILAFDVG